MPINMELIDGGNVLWVQINGDWKPEDIAPAKEQTQRIFKQAQHPIHSLVDLRHASVNIPLIRASQQVIGGEALPNAGQIAVVGVPWLIRAVAEPILRASNPNDPISFFNSIEDAQKHLRRFFKV